MIKKILYPGLDVTGFCWSCGRACEGLFCNERHQRHYDKDKLVEEKRLIRRGKRAGYGLAGSTSG